jgi:hypothetical protein
LAQLTVAARRTTTPTVEIGLGAVVNRVVTARRHTHAVSADSALAVVGTCAPCRNRTRAALATTVHVGLDAIVFPVLAVRRSRRADTAGTQPSDAIVIDEATEPVGACSTAATTIERGLGAILNVIVTVWLRVYTYAIGAALARAITGQVTASAHRTLGATAAAVDVRLNPIENLVIAASSGAHPVDAATTGAISRHRAGTSIGAGLASSATVDARL